MSTLSKLDLGILERLQQDGRLSNAKLANELGVSETPCWRRLKKLEEEGIIEGYQANLNRRKLGYGVMAFVHISCRLHDDKTTADFEQRIIASENVLTCHNTAGTTDYVLQVVAKDLDDYSHFVESVLRKLPGVSSLQSNLSLKELKSSNRFPLA